MIVTIWVWLNVVCAFLWLAFVYGCVCLFVFDVCLLFVFRLRCVCFVCCFGFAVDLLCFLVCLLV